MKKVTVEITDDFKVKFDYEGFQGDACLKDFNELLKELERAGIKLEEKDTKKKRDFYVRTHNQVRQR